MNNEPMRDAANARRKQTPGPEGWGRSAAAIERTLGFLADAERARILGLNAARFFREPLIKREVFAAQGCTA